MNESLPEHLGGHMNKVHTDRATLLYLQEKYDINSMVDVGCGPGDMVMIAKDRGINAMGIDGDFTLQDMWKARELPIVLHDFTKSEVAMSAFAGWDLGWSVEFLEHVEEKYMDNWMAIFEKCKYIVCTAAPPGHAGHHHVNCQTREYWIEKFDGYGFEYDEEETEYIRTNSVMRKPFMQRNGMFYVRKD